MKSWVESWARVNCSSELSILILRSRRNQRIYSRTKRNKSHQLDVARVKIFRVEQLQGKSVNNLALKSARSNEFRLFLHKNNIRALCDLANLALTPISSSRGDLVAVRSLIPRLFKLTFRNALFALYKSSRKLENLFVRYKIVQMCIFDFAHFYLLTYSLIGNENYIYTFRAGFEIRLRWPCSLFSTLIRRHFFDFSYRKKTCRSQFRIRSRIRSKLPADFDRSEFNSSSSLNFSLCSRVRTSVTLSTPNRNPLLLIESVRTIIREDRTEESLRAIISFNAHATDLSHERTYLVTANRVRAIVDVEMIVAV